VNGQIKALGGLYLNPRMFRIARNQREAGIDKMEWESRAKPMRPLYYDFVAVVFLALIFVSIIGVFDYRAEHQRSVRNCNSVLVVGVSGQRTFVGPDGAPCMDGHKSA
jgi:hypothetical protein